MKYYGWKDWWGVMVPMFIAVFIPFFIMLYQSANIAPLTHETMVQFIDREELWSKVSYEYIQSNFIDGKELKIEKVIYELPDGEYYVLNQSIDSVRIPHGTVVLKNEHDEIFTAENKKN